MSVPGPQKVLEIARVIKTFGKGATAVAALRHMDLTLDPIESVTGTGPAGSATATLVAVPLTGHLAN